MFTGLIEAVGTLRGLRPRSGGLALLVHPGEMDGLPGLGESVAVDGVCLTVSGREGPCLRFDAMGDTLLKTNLGRARPGKRVNLERAMPADGRFEGHIVQGHVCATGRVISNRKAGEGRILSIEAPAALSGEVVPEGSVALNGVSLTIAEMRPSPGGVVLRFSLVPHTLRRTNLAFLVPGDELNLETDILLRARGASLKVEEGAPRRSALSTEAFAAWGYA